VFVFDQLLKHMNVNEATTIMWATYGCCLQSIFSIGLFIDL